MTESEGRDKTKERGSTESEKIPKEALRAQLDHGVKIYVPRDPKEPQKYSSLAR